MPLPLRSEPWPPGRVHCPSCQGFAGVAHRGGRRARRVRPRVDYSGGGTGGHGGRGRLGRAGEAVLGDRAQARSWHRDGRVHRRRGCGSRQVGSGRHCAHCRRRTSPFDRTVRSRREGRRRRRSQRRSARSFRPRRGMTPGRSDGRVAGGVRRRLRLVATDSYRLAMRDLQGVEHAPGRPEGARRGQGTR